MKIVMTLLVRDEDDILEANLRYHLDQGIDHVIVTDNLSVDGTRDIVERYVGQGVATYIHESEDTYAQSKWVSRMAGIAHGDLGADWVVHTDADEFWVPANGDSLARFFRKCWLYNVVSAPRHDFVCVEGEDGAFWERMVYRKARSLNPLGRPLPPKVAHRARAGVVVAQGNHSVDGMGWQRKKSKGIEILHFPLRSRAQYTRKIENGGRAYAQNTELDVSVGSTWRKQYAELQETGTLKFLEENVVSTRDVEDLLASGDVLRDTRLEAYFRANPGG